MNMMSEPIKAIETRYKGYRFRSRLEARWAVFFDAIDVRWEYEPQGFRLSDGTMYLPDFHLPGFHQRDKGIYVECKPHVGTHRWKNALQLAADADVCVLLADGEPAAKVYQLAVPITMAPMSTRRDSLMWDSFFYSKYLPGGSCGHEYRLFVMPCDGEFRPPWEAIFAARGARFEHGESGLAPQQV
jgi:hypothetical protein